MIVLLDDPRARSFEPFATTRPLGEVRAGAVLIRERWAHVLSAPAIGFVSSPHLSGFSEFAAPPAHEGAVPAGTWLVNTRALPHL
ncbi:MAG: putative sugar nucleotidyl transferase, partial [Gemmatimonas sp.]